MEPPKGTSSFNRLAVHGWVLVDLVDVTAFPERTRTGYDPGTPGPLVYSGPEYGGTLVYPHPGIPGFRACPQLDKTSRTGYAEHRPVPSVDSVIGLTLSAAPAISPRCTVSSHEFIELGVGPRSASHAPCCQRRRNSHVLAKIEQTDSGFGQRSSRHYVRPGLHQLFKIAREAR